MRHYIYVLILLVFLTEEEIGQDVLLEIIKDLCLTQ